MSIEVPERRGSPLISGLSLDPSLFSVLLFSLLFHRGTAYSAISSR